MSSCLLLFLASLLTSSLMAQVNKIPADTRLYLQRLQTSNKKAPGIDGTPKQREAKLFLSCAPDADTKAIETQLEEIGARPQGTIGRYIMVSCPAGAVGQIADIQGVTFISKSPRVSPKTLVSKEVTGVSKVHSGTENLPQAFTGKDVVVGVIDLGFDFTHPAFQDADGNLRIKAFYSPFMPQEEEGYEPVVTLDGTELDGKAYTTPEEILALGTDYGGDSHGTHTSITAAGSTFGWAGGMAPDADIVLCEYQNGQLFFVEDWGYNVIQGIQYIRDYAKRAGKPYVVSISLNSHDGPHDGTGPVTSILNQLALENTNIAMCASNEGCDSCYVNYAYAANDTLHTIMAGMLSYAYARNPGDMSFQLGLFDISTGTETWRSEPLHSNGEGCYFYIDFQNNVIEGDFEKCYDIVDYLKDIVKDGYMLFSIGNMEDGRARMSFEHKGLPDNYIFTLHIACPENSMVDLWGDYGTFFLGLPGSDYYSRGSSRVSMGDFCTGGNLITVGSWVAKESFINIQGETIEDWTLPEGGSPGTYTYFSSYGIDLAGYSHPFVSTPGSSIISAVNHFDPSYLPKTEDVVAQDADGYLWAAMSGTSMATPTAAGIIALWLEAKPDLTYEQIKEAIAATAITDEFTEAAPHRFGHGKMDAYKGLLYVLGISTAIPQFSQHQPKGLKFRMDGNTLYIDGLDNSMSNVLPYGQAQAEQCSMFNVQCSMIFVYSSDGRLVASAPLASGSVSLPAGSPAGVYAVQVGTLGSTLIRIK
ncbi:MAG: S8 family serine peptidase [Bacteroidales bacterium]|nr:S8 family serine peptidase [Bacteroidales bacterium]